MRHLVALARERRYLLVDEMIEALALSADVNSPEEVNELLSTFERSGINGYDDVSAAKAADIVPELGGTPETEAKEDEVSDQEVEPNLTPGALEGTIDPVRVYLREMGSVPLLTHEGEVALAKRIESVRLVVTKTITHQNALRNQREYRTYAPGGGEFLCGHARAHPADRSESTAEAAASFTIGWAARFSGKLIT